MPFRDCQAADRALTRIWRATKVIPISWSRGADTGTIPSALSAERAMLASASG